ncbi:hypothetical protein [Kitasatospora sp. NPDC094016]|uniref:hypothetical protein n=1 Tax=Kitasatospora sp. NPDC094016 TaxID=3154986 RepID=UPI0033189AB7
MNKYIARTAAIVLLTAGIVAVPTAGSAFASSRGGEFDYSHQVSATAGDVSYSESSQASYITGYGEDSHGSHSGYGQGHHGSNGLGYGHGLLGLGLIVL